MKRYLQICVIALLSTLLFSACLTQIALNYIGVTDKKATLKYATNSEKKLVSVYIHHIGKKEYYIDVKNKIDSFLKEGYIVYYEAVRPGVYKDSLQKDSINRKARKISGVDFVTMKANGGYIDTMNNKLFGKKSKYVVKHRLINQPKYLIAVNDSINFKNIDANMIELVNACENKFGVITLEKYDYEVNFGEKYRSKKDKKMKAYFLEGFRNNLISQSILNDSNKKIILIYGGKHFKGILENLNKSDKEYKEVDKL